MEEGSFFRGGHDIGKGGGLIGIGDNCAHINAFSSHKVPNVTAIIIVAHPAVAAKGEGGIDDRDIGKGIASTTTDTTADSVNIGQHPWGGIDINGFYHIYNQVATNGNGIFHNSIPFSIDRYRIPLFCKKVNDSIYLYNCIIYLFV